MIFPFLPASGDLYRGHPLPFLVKYGILRLFKTSAEPHKKSFGHHTKGESILNTDKMKEFFKRDRFAGMIGVKIESITAAEVVCVLEIEERHLNASDYVQGGVVFTLADFTLAVASNYDDFTENKKNVTVSHSINITFFKPASGKKLIAKSRCVQKGRKLSVYRVAVTDDTGTNVAEITGNAYTVSL